MATLTFHGAAQEVTGSCHLLEVNGCRVLLDCGMHQGGKSSEKRNAEPFPFNVNNIDAVVLSHGHLDHSGLLPKLYKDGYKGPLYCTEATANLLAVMLEDSANLHMRDVEWENKRRVRAGKKPLEPLYDLTDVLNVLEHSHGVAYGEKVIVADGIEVCFHDAGHIIGSAIVALEFAENGESKKVVFSGDLGNPDAVLMHDPALFKQADVVLMEGTYGDRDHRSLENTLEELNEILQQAYEDEGNVIIPSFAVGRTQEMLYHLALLYTQGRLKQQKIFLDSPMGIEVTELYDDYIELLDRKDLLKLSPSNGDTFKGFLPSLTLTPTTEESMSINRIKSGAVIIAGSGMCNGGRVRHHLKHNIWRSECHVVFPGFQAGGTLGRLIVDGARHIKMFGNLFAVKAQIHTLGGFSAHAGQSQLLDWAGNFTNHPRFYLVHGEAEALKVLQKTLSEKLGLQADIPTEGAVTTI
ncbi:MAG: MBL fold metallo-hydrolase [Pseudomonadales bacterium]|nr:MBL fold metallo-hydrolase [Pseudomonadales bacterium]